MKVIVPCVWGQLFCSVNSAARHIAGNATPGGMHCRLPDHQFVRLSQAAPLPRFGSETIL